MRILVQWKLDETVVDWIFCTLFPSHEMAEDVQIVLLQVQRC